jgi:hypothetical protein
MTNKVQPKLENVGSMITYKDGDKDRCLGYLLATEPWGVYDATFGKVDVTPEQAKIHNGLLDEASLVGLDQGCAVGQGGTFYFTTEGGPPVVKTWLGTVVSDQCEREGRSLTFWRAGKKFRGTITKDGDSFNFKRIE